MFQMKDYNYKIMSLLKTVLDKIFSVKPISTSQHTPRTSCLVLCKLEAANETTEVTMRLWRILCELTN